MEQGKEAGAERRQYFAKPDFRRERTIRIKKANAQRKIGSPITLVEALVGKKGDLRGRRKKNGGERSCREERG